MYRQKWCLTIGFFSILALIFQAGVGFAQEATNSSKVDPALGEKQTYRPLSPFVPPKLPPIKKISSLDPKKRELILKLKAAHDKKPEDTRIIKLLGQRLYSFGLYESCKNTLLHYLDELDKKSKLILVRCLEKRLDYRNKVKVIENMLIYDSKNYQLYTRVGDAYYELREADKAINNYRQAISINPKFVAPYKRLLDLFKETENTYEQRQLLLEMIKELGEQPVYLTEQCRLFSLEAFFDQTINVCLKAVRSNPKIADNHVRLGVAYKESGDTDKGLKVLTRAARSFKKSEFAQWALGQYYYDKESYPIAFRYFRQAVAAKEDSHRSRLGMAQSAFEIGRYDLSLENFKKACQYDNKETIVAFRGAASRLRQDKNYNWIKKFDSESRKCRIAKAF